MQSVLEIRENFNIVLQVLESFWIKKSSNQFQVWLNHRKTIPQKNKNKVRYHNILQKLYV